MPKAIKKSVCLGELESYIIGKTGGDTRENFEMVDWDHARYRASKQASQRATTNYIVQIRVRLICHHTPTQ